MPQLKKFVILSCILLLFSSIVSGCSASPCDLTDDEVLAKFEESKELYNLFYLSAAEGDGNDAIESDSGEIFYRVSDENICTKEKLNTLLCSHFDADTVTEMWADGPYMESNGYLYSNESARGTDITLVDETLAVSRPSKKKIVLTAAVRYDSDLDGSIDSTEEYEFILQNTDDKWVFTDYPCYW